MSGSIRSTLRTLLTSLLMAAAASLPLTAAAGRLVWAELAPRAGSPAPAFMPAPIPKVAGGIVEVVEFYNAGLGHYFISADPNEIAVLAGGAFGGAWKRTGGTFPAWDVTGAPPGTVPVCRFFGTDRYRMDGTRIGPNSHFYTADPDECAFVKTAWQSLANNGVSYPAWTFEANAFAVRLPVGGACPAGTQPLYRAYNNGAGGDPNHRYSMQIGILQGMTGWAFEGLVMCLPQGQAGTTLPPQLAACGGADCPASATPLGNGIDLVNVVVEIANPTGAPVELLIAAGQTFLSTTGHVQDGLAVERLQATIAPGATGRFLLRLFCMQQSRSASKTGETYAPGPVTANAQLLEIVALTDGKLGSTNDPVGLKASSVQFAIWEITDGRGALSAQQRSLFTAIMATPASDLLTLATLTEQFFATLSTPP